MNEIDGFYEAMDSESLLKEHGAGLVADAREVLAQDPALRVAGMITTPDAPEAEPLRKMLAQGGELPPLRLMVGLVPRESVEALLKARVGTEPWLEQGWQPQTVLPVIASTRNGHRFAFFPVHGQSERGAAM